MAAYMSAIGADIMLYVLAAAAQARDRSKRRLQLRLNHCAQFTANV